MPVSSLVAWEPAACRCSKAYWSGVVKQHLPDSAFRVNLIENRLLYIDKTLRCLRHGRIILHLLRSAVQESGKLAEAEDMYQRALKGDEKAPGYNQPKCEVIRRNLISLGSLRGVNKMPLFAYPRTCIWLGNIYGTVELTV